MWKQNTGSILVTGVPVERGRPAHIEHDNDEAHTDFDKSGKVERIHTPPDAFRRVHEMMHARNTDMKRARRQYKGVDETVWNIIEDCRIHMNHWPWRRRLTPDVIEQATKAYLDEETAKMVEALAEAPEKRGTFPDFGTRLRQATVRMGLGEGFGEAIDNVGFATETQAKFARKILADVKNGREGKAARQVQAIFIPPREDGELPDGYWADDDGSRSGIKRGAARGYHTQPPMEIIELAHTEAIADAKISYRRATSGSRLHRPSLRKPVLPQRLFIRRTPREIGGTILVDASGSMGDWSQVKRWCEKAPFGTIAYYAGNGSSGKLFVYARNGRRAAKIVNPNMGGNTVDGPAMDWLMTQAKPRRMITDRGFCDVADSLEQVMRLELLERAGEIEVLDYAHDIEHAVADSDDDE